MTVFVKSAIFSVVMRFSENFAATASNVTLLISTVILPKNDDLKALENSVQIDYLLGRDGVKCVIHRKSSKMML